MKLSLKALRINSGIPTNQILKKINKTATWLSLVENGKRKIDALALWHLLEIYGMTNLRIDQIFLPKDISKSYAKNKLISSRAKRNSNRKRAK